MEKRKFHILVVIVGILLIIGISYAYFTSDFTIENNPSSVTVTTATIDDVKLAVEGTLNFDDRDILPGHRNISAIKVTALSDNTIVEYNLIWKGINELETPLKYYVYRTTSEETPSISCIKTQSGNANFRKYFEECENNNFDNLGEIIYEGQIETTNVEKNFTLATNQVLKGNTNGNSVYYYVVLEFPNEEDNQNKDMNKKFDGVVTVEETEAKLADITINKIYTVDKTGKQTEVKKAPGEEEGYTLDKNQSSCENGTLDWDDDNYALKVSATETGTSCNLYFKKIPTSADVLENLGLSSKVNGTSPNFSKTACDSGCETTDKGLYKTQDDDGDTYYFRGSVTDNWVKFAEYYWRIIRINGDGTIRLIYSGKVGDEDNLTFPNSNRNNPAYVTGTGTQVTIDSSTKLAFNTNIDQNRYVGYMYGSSSGDYSTSHKNDSPSNIKTKLESWYSTNLENVSVGGKTAKDYIDEDAGFCGDRTPYNGSSDTASVDYTKGGTTTGTFYGGYFRLVTQKTPDLHCKRNTTSGATTLSEDNDLYTVNNSKKEIKQYQNQ